MFCLYQYNRFKFCMIILKFMLVLSIIIGFDVITYCLCIAAHLIHCFAESVDHIQKQRGAIILLFWLNTIFVWVDSFHIFDALKFILHHSHIFFNFRFYHIPIKKFLWSHTICCLNNHHHRRDKSSCSVYTDTIVSNYTC